MFIQRVNIFLLSLFIAFMPAYAMAVIDPPFTFGDVKFDKALGQYDYKMFKTDQYGISREYRAKVPYSSSTAGSIMRKRILQGGVYGVLGAAAVSALLEGVGWVIDPEAQSIWRNKAVAGTDTSCDALIPYYGTQFLQGKTCQYTGNFITSTQGTFPELCAGNTFNGVWQSSGACAGIHTDEKEELTDSDLGEAMIGNKTSGNHLAETTPTLTGAKEAGTPTTPTEDDNPFYNDAKTKATPKPVIPTSDEPPEPNEDGDCPAGTAKDSSHPGKCINNNLGPEDNKKIPAFCTWAKVMCDWIDWTKKEEPDLDTNLDLDETPQSTDTQINFNGQCPSPITLLNSSWHGQAIDWKLDFSQMCSVFTTFVKPVVIAMGGLSAVLIISGVRENG